MTRQLPILIVEDSLDDALLLRAQLERAGVCNPCFTVTTGDEALEYVEGRGKYSDRQKFPQPKVVLLDLRLPGMDGFELMRKLKAPFGNHHVLMVAVSGLDDLQSIRRAYQLGADSFLAKPCSKLDIVGLIEGFPRFWMLSGEGAADAPKDGRPSNLHSSDMPG